MHTCLIKPLATSCLNLPVAELHRRTDIAEAQEEAKRTQYSQPDGQYGREIMWHPSFPAECVAMLSNMPLYEVGPWLLDCHADSHNEGKPLDFTDYCYLADVLREGLASNPTPLAALRLSRALAWVEQVGTDLINTQQQALAREVQQNYFYVEQNPEVIAARQARAEAEGAEYRRQWRERHASQLAS